MVGGLHVGVLLTREHVGVGACRYCLYLTMDRATDCSHILSEGTKHQDHSIVCQTIKAQNIVMSDVMLRGFDQTYLGGVFE